MKTPKICRLETDLSNTKAGWYAMNSVVTKDIRPIFRIPGGGCTRDEFSEDLVAALDKCIEYSKHRIAEAEAHIRKWS